MVWVSVAFWIQKLQENEKKLARMIIENGIGEIFLIVASYLQ